MAQVVKTVGSDLDLSEVKGKPFTNNNNSLRGATDEIIEVSVETLGINIEHLVRPILESDVYDLASKDESRWEPIEVRPWPVEWEKPEPSVLYHVVSGNHRTSAARIKQLPTLRARLIEARDELSYLKAAIRSNTQHGRNFTRDEYIINAKKLQAQGLPLGEIASELGYSKSTVSRWLTGTDSHAASKQKQHDAIDTSYTHALTQSESSISQVKSKVMGLIMDAGLAGNVVEARAYVSTLKPNTIQIRRTTLWMGLRGRGER